MHFQANLQLVIFQPQLKIEVGGLFCLPMAKSVINFTGYNLAFVPYRTWLAMSCCLCLTAVRMGSVGVS